MVNVNANQERDKLRNGVVRSYDEAVVVSGYARVEAVVATSEINRRREEISIVGIRDATGCNAHCRDGSDEVTVTTAQKR